FAGSATTLPMSGSTDNTVRAENKPDQDEFYVNADYDFVTGNYHRAMGMKLQRGRLFTEQDNTTAAPRVALITESLANKVFDQQDALGQRVQFLGQSWQVVGIIGDVRHHGLDRDRLEHIYMPQVHGFFQSSLVACSSVPPLNLADPIRRIIFQLDPEQPIANIRTMEHVVAQSMSDRHLMSVLLSLFAAVALLLAAIGLYGVMAYAVTQRTREMGIRVALGAPPSKVLGLVISKGLKLTAVGIILGLLGAVVTRVLAHLLYDVSPTDVTTLVSVTAVLGGAALLACWIPARRAAKIDPMRVLRYE
ncbi:FtsX-like permease family protein, partial [Planctomycetota bacterium]